jgi:hypothetical protein
MRFMWITRRGYKLRSCGVLGLGGSTTRFLVEDYVMSCSKFLVAFVAAFAIASSARADVFSITDSISGSSVATKTYAFTITDPAIYNATLLDLGNTEFPLAFQMLELGVVKTGSSPVLGFTTEPGTFSFTANTPGSYTLLLVGQPDATAQAGFFSINVSEFAPIPEPAIWFLMASGIGLIGFLKLRSRDRVVDA